MIESMFLVSGFLAWLLAGLAVLLGRNLTRSVMIAYAFVSFLCLSMLLAGAGVLAVIVSTLALLGFANIQVFGWMLVDVDRDHLVPTDGPTWVARALAVALLGGGLAVLVYAMTPELVPITAVAETTSRASAVALGEALFGPLGGAAVLFGLSIAAGLLAAVLLVRDDVEGG